VGPRAVLETVVKRKIPSPRRESNHIIPIIQPGAITAFAVNVDKVNASLQYLNICTIWLWKGTITENIE
jgi:hypothetical protein